MDINVIVVPGGRRRHELAWGAFQFLHGRDKCCTLSRRQCGNGFAKCHNETLPLPRTLCSKWYRSYTVDLNRDVFSSFPPKSFERRIRTGTQVEPETSEFLHIQLHNPRDSSPLS